MTKLTTFMFFIIIYIIFFLMFIMIMNYFNLNSLIIILIMYSLLIFITLSLWAKNYMYSIIMFLTLISGLLVIFLYFTSLISNMKNNFHLNLKSIMLFMMILFFPLNMLINSNKKFTNSFPLFLSMNFNNSSSLNNMNSINSLNNKIFSNIFNLYLYPYNNMTLLCMFFLLLSLFSIIKICLIKSSSLRKIK